MGRGRGKGSASGHRSSGKRVHEEDEVSLLSVTTLDTLCGAMRGMSRSPWGQTQK